jgi:hypothetical protein
VACALKMVAKTWSWLRDAPCATSPHFSISAVGRIYFRKCLVLTRTLNKTLAVKTAVAIIIDSTRRG